MPGTGSLNPAGSHGRSGVLTAFAAAKVNLALHVTGRRNDGYHLLDTLVVFPDIGDRLSAEPGDSVTLVLEGPFAAALSAESADGDLVLKAARLLATLSPRPLPGARLTLEKALPVASGIGGGSADAAAALRLLCSFWNLEPDEAELHGLALQLGADVPMCLASKTARITGIGEDIVPLAGIPPFGIVLANPGVPVPTPLVFAKLASRDNPPLPAIPGGGFESLSRFIDWLGSTRNDLEASAIEAAGEIADVLNALRSDPDVALARMSGSGATCFAITGSRRDADAIAARLRQTHPDWWIAAGAVA
ncbi:4-(cytidine 5'-diphospho)-2-C-methyl-D-erythritol kinase [Stappia sp. F7233]|uniref:4-diphosphocytidyl-2-C-methyl-D-erythritol kinase n=1 Tax=Stappia albiluteola TaxID=2758565 RepID=A0A839AET2_9HYPH|nr:4-(cytidine 5'-diphospho)-2-C-methyl-D-erythritol kinase [Stappia albiluteola]MBA5777645.1 4-(cytidine 5'-diphospho)-2-C-methyl-D-erythritol kinase [Stappia albiluteola]